MKPHPDLFSDLFSQNDACFANVWKTGAPLGMLYFSKKYDIPIVRAGKEIEGYPLVLWSFTSSRDFYALAAAAPHKGDSEWIAGGNAVISPVGCEWIMDYLFMGSGLAAFPKILEGDRDIHGLYSCAKRDPVDYSDEPLPHEAWEKNQVAMSKGCRRRCTFCVHPWRTEYEEQDEEWLVKWVNENESKAPKLASNAANDVSFYDRISSTLSESGRTNAIPSNMVNGITDAFVKNRTAEVLVGVEGMSAFLRSIVNKPMEQEMIVDAAVRSLEAGIRGFRQVHQFNLPTENESDWIEFEETIRLINERARKGAMSIPFIPHHPSPHTPLQYVSPRYDLDMLERIIEFRKSLFGSGKRGIATYVPMPLHPKRFVAQLLPDFIPITAEVVAAAKKLPTKATLPEMRDRLDSLGVDTPEQMWTRSPSDEYPWDVVRVMADRAEMMRRYNTMAKKASVRPALSPFEEPQVVG